MLTEGIITAMIASVIGPAVLLLLGRLPLKRANNKLDDVLLEVEKLSSNLNKYQVEQALKDFSSKTIKIIEGNSGAVTIEEWITSKTSLEALLPIEKWPDNLVKEANAARDLIRKGKI